MNAENNFEYCRGKIIGFFVLVCCTETSTIWVALGCHNCVFYFDEGKAKLYVATKL